MSAPPLAEYIRTIVEGASSLPLGQETMLMCEPGHAIVADGMSVVTKLYLRRDDRLYFNDGIFCSFAESSFNLFELLARLIKTDGLIGKGSKAFTIFGPTCGSNDQLPQAVSLPGNVREGDWIEFWLLGAYSNGLSTNFNGFGPRRFGNIEES